MPWTPAQNRMWHARAKRGDKEAIEVLSKEDYTVKSRPRGAAKAVKRRAAGSTRR